MASKAEKRKAAVAKRAAFLAEIRSDGLAAQKADKARQEREAAALKAFAEDINFKQHEILSRAGLR
jgi:hypothetical protein